MMLKMLPNKDLNDFETNSCNGFRLYFASQLSLQVGKKFYAKQMQDLYLNFSNYGDKNKLLLDSKMNLIDTFTTTELGKLGISKNLITKWKNENKQRHLNYNVAQAASLVYLFCCFFVHSVFNIRYYSIHIYFFFFFFF